MTAFTSAVLALFVLGSTHAWRRGAAPERYAVAIILLWLLLDGAHHIIAGPATFDTVDPVHLVLDTAELVALVWLATRANRVWPLFAAAAQVMCVTGHVAVLVEQDGLRRAYWAMTQLPQYIQLVALLAGVVAHEKRARVIGRYRSWRYT